MHNKQHNAYVGFSHMRIFQNCLLIGTMMTNSDKPLLSHVDEGKGQDCLKSRHIGSQSVTWVKSSKTCSLHILIEA